MQTGSLDTYKGPLCSNLSTSTVVKSQFISDENMNSWKLDAGLNHILGQIRRPLNMTRHAVTKCQKDTPKKTNKLITHSDTRDLRSCPCQSRTMECIVVGILDLIADP